MSEQLTERDIYIAQAPIAALELIRSHIEAPDSGLDYLIDDPLAPVNYPGQDPMEFYVAGHPLPKEDVDKVAEIIVPGYTRTVDELTTDSQASAIFDTTYALLDRGESVVVNTLHVGDIKDIAFALKAADDILRAKHQLRLEQTGQPEATERFWETMIALNKAMAWARADFKGHKAGIVSTLQILCNHMVLPWPNTDNSEKVRGKLLPLSEVNRHNKSVIRVSNKLLGKANPAEEDAVTEEERNIPDNSVVLAAIALTGTTRVQKDEDGKSRVSSISDSSAGLTVGSYMLPMTAALDREEPIIHPCAEPVLIESPEQVDELTQLMVADFNEQVPGLDLVYEPPTHRLLGRLAAGR